MARITADMIAVPAVPRRVRPTLRLLRRKRVMVPASSAVGALLALGVALLPDEAFRAFAGAGALCILYALGYLDGRRAVATDALRG